MTEGTHPLVDNARLRDAIAAFTAEPGEAAFLEALRQVFQGDILFDITGSDMRMNGATIEAGSTFRIHQGSRELPDGSTESALFAYTRQEEAQRMHPDAPAQTIGQPSPDLFASAKAMGADAVIVDQAIRFALTGLPFLELPRNDALKAALATQGGQAAFDVLRKNGTLLYALGEEDRVIMSRASDGQPVLMAFTSAAEAFAVEPRARAVPVDVRRAVADGLAQAPGGLVINPKGPFLHLDRPALEHLRTDLEGES